MNDNLLHLYHKLPGPARSVAASLRGYGLKRWRYGHETDRLVEAARERESWSEAEWRSWREERLAFVLHRAATRVPYYAQQWAQRRLRGDNASWTRLENWPILEKEPVRKNSKAFVADDCTLSRMFRDHTSGTEGKPLDLWQSKDTVRSWYALFEARVRQWYGVSRHDRWAILGGQVVTPVSQQRPPFWVWNAALKQLYMSSYHLAPHLIPRYLEALGRYRVRYLLGYTSSLYVLAQEALRLKFRDLQLAVAITNAEPVLAHQRSVIAEAFQCPVQETYGMAEIAFAASECSVGGLHTWPEAGFAEVDPDHETGQGGKSGDLICTSLLNCDMPLIRYRVGDRVTLPATQTPCGCGRGLPLMTSIEGRADDILYTSDGRRIGRLDPVFKSDLAIREAQIIQEALGVVRLRFVPAPEYTPQDGRAIAARIKERMGNVDVILEAVTEIARTRNGKFRAVICNLPPEQVMYLREQRSVAVGR